MLREGNIDDAREFARITVEAMRQEEEAARDLGLDPDRFSAEGDASFTPIPIYRSPSRLVTNTCS